MLRVSAIVRLRPKLNHVLDFFVHFLDNDGYKGGTCPHASLQTVLPIDKGTIPGNSDRIAREIPVTRLHVAGVTGDKNLGRRPVFSIIL